MRIMWVMLALLSACATHEAPHQIGDGGDAGIPDSSDIGPDVDAEPSDGGTQDDAATDAAADAVPDVEEPDCLCEGVSECCDGCQPRNVGEACDDGRECTSASSCDEFGVCRGESDACDYLLTDPQCQAVACDDVLGCGAVGSIRQGLPCDDGDDRTYDDRCDAGACVGTACECSGETECCDGCHAKNEGLSCSEPIGGTYGSATCEAGQCVGEPCECTEGPCCDGCLLKKSGVACDDAWRGGCYSSPQTKPGSYWQEFGAVFCSGTSPECDGATVWGGVEGPHSCGAEMRCDYDGTPWSLCQP